VSEFSSPNIVEVVSNALDNLSKFEVDYLETSKEDEGALADVYERFIEDLRDNEYDLIAITDDEKNFHSNIDIKVLKKIFNLIKQINKPSKKERQSKLLEIQHSEFWDSLYEFRIHLEQLLSEAIKRERIV